MKRSIDYEWWMAYVFVEEDWDGPWVAGPFNSENEGWKAIEEFGKRSDTPLNMVNHYMNTPDGERTHAIVRKVYKSGSWVV